MGAFFTNYQVRGKSASDVSKALESLVETRAYVSTAKGGWVTVYDEASDQQDDGILKHIAAELSKKLSTAVFVFLVHDSDIAVYWLYQDGILIDEFNSAPDYFGKVADEAKSRVRGNVDTLLPLCVAGTSREQVEEAIHPASGFPTFAEDILGSLSPLLAIDGGRMTLGFRYFDEEGEETLEDASEFTPVGANAPNKKAQPPKRAAKRPAVTLDFFSVAIRMMARCWTEKQKEKADAIKSRYPNQIIDITGQLSAGYDGVAQKFLRNSTLPDTPTFQELKAARDQGPDALAKLLVQRTPTQLGRIAASAIDDGLVQFIAALLANGMDPNAVDQHGDSLLSLAEGEGKTEIYNLLKSAIEKKN